MQLNENFQIPVLEGTCERQEGRVELYSLIS
jgi:hypothetical protein